MFAVLFDFLLIHHKKNELIRNQMYDIESNLANYNTYMLVNYGLYSTNTIESNKRSETSFMHIKDYNQNMYSISSLADTNTVKKQIIEFMKYRIGVNYVDQLLSKLDVITKSKASTEALDIKKEIDDISLVLEKGFTKKVKLSELVNDFSKEKQEDFIKDFKILNIDILEVDLSRESLVKEINVIEEVIVQLEIEVKKIENLMTKDNENKENLQIRLDDLNNRIMIQINYLYKLLVDEEEIDERQKIIIDKLSKMTELIDEYIKYNSELLKVIEKLDIDSKKVFSIMDQVIMDLDSSESLVIKEVTESLIEDINKTRTLINTHLSKVETKLNYDVEEYKFDIKKELVPLLNVLKENIKILESLKEKLGLDEVRKGYVNIEVMNSYFNEFDIESTTKNIDKEKEDYYRKQKKISEESYETSEDDFAEVSEDKQLYNTSKEHAAFWTVCDLVSETTNNIYENVLLNEYIISTFKSFCLVSETDFNYFDKYNREHFFYKGEVEYILFGDKKERVNVLKAGGIIFSIRSAMNLIHIYTNSEKMTFSESIGVAVAGWTGIGIPIVSNIVRLGWGVGESMIDMKELYEGKSTPFYKLYSNQWKTDLGMLDIKGKLSTELKLFNFTYHDYLRFMLLTLNEDVKISRIMDLISLNLETANRDPNLDNYYTELKIDSSGHVDTLFLDFKKFKIIKNSMKMGY